MRAPAALATPADLPAQVAQWPPHRCGPPGLRAGRARSAALDGPSATRAQGNTRDAHGVCLLRTV